ncbi:LCP family protein [Candidatus Riflebacteria bacterium]
MVGSKKKRILDFIGVLLVLLFTWVVFFLMGMSLKPLRPRIRTQEIPLKGFTITGEKFVLLTGIDSVQKTHRSDTIILVHLNFDKKKIYLLSIPRDTRVLIKKTSDGRDKFGKINAAFAYGGVEKLRIILEDILNIEIDYHMVVDYQAFVKFVDIIGGVELNIEKGMHYEDKAGGLKINFRKGKQVLSGKQSLEYVRFRGGPLADIGRIARQQKFLKRLFGKLKVGKIIFNLPAIIQTILSYIITDIPPEEILKVSKHFINMSRSKLTSGILPGIPQYIEGVSFYVVNPDKISTWLQSKINPAVQSRGNLIPIRPKYDEKKDNIE